jgi:hypothetical protein
VAATESFPAFAAATGLTEKRPGSSRVIGCKRNGNGVTKGKCRSWMQNGVTRNCWKNYAKNEPKTNQPEV